MRLIATLAAALVVAAPASAASGSDGVLRCPAGLSLPGREPVLLVHGTSSDSVEAWSWNYARALPALGLYVCAVDLPDRALGDIQVAAEDVASAVRRLHAMTGSKVDVVGHSQGALEPRWAIRRWPDVGAAVDDLVSLAGPHHGATTIDALCAAGRCPLAAWQMTTGSPFLAALNDGDETPGDVDVTSVISLSDGVVVPPDTARLDGASNVVLQDLCPGRVVDHGRILGDEAAYAIVVDALTQDGGADLGRVDPGVCG